MQEQAAPKMCQPVFLLELCILNFHEGAAKSISENMVLLKLTL